MQLRELQELREARRRQGLSDAVAATVLAAEKLNETQDQLNAAKVALDDLVHDGALPLDEFRILANRISLLDNAASNDRLSHAKQREFEADARADWQCAERQTHHLDKEYREMLRKECRKSEDKSAREFLDSRAARKGR